MRRSSALFAVTLAALCLIRSTAFAVPINPINSRPVPVTPHPGSISDLQTIVDGQFGSGLVDVDTDQANNGEWSVISGLPGSVPLSLIAEFTANENLEKFGIWSGTDTSSITKVDILLGPAGVGTGASLSWDASGNLSVSAAGGATCGTEINCFSSLSGIDPFAFGFYIVSAGGNTYYSVDQLNSGPLTARGLGFNKPGTNDWVLAFEEDAPNGSSDYNDLVVRINSIQSPSTAPEPSSLLLLGSGLLGLGFLRRKFIR